MHRGGSHPREQTYNGRRLARRHLVVSPRPREPCPRRFLLAHLSGVHRV